MAANEVEYMGIVVDLDVSGADTITNAAKEISKLLLRSGNDSEHAKQELINFFDAINHKLVSMGKSPIMKDHIKTLIEASVNTAAKELEKLDKELEKLFKRKKKPESELAKRRNIFADFTESRMGKAITAFRALNIAFSEAQGVWKFAEGISEINQRLLLLHYSSGIGIGSLKDFGAAASAFGGSEASIASAEERRQEQLARARRGEGFGYLQEANWKYGFNIDLAWDANRTRDEAIKFARANVRPEEWMPFFKLIDPANAKWMSGIARMSPERFERYLQYQKELQKYEKLKTERGKNRADSIAVNTQDYKMATAQLSLSWKAIKDEIGNALLPLMTRIVQVITQITDHINKYPEIIRGISYLVSGIATLIAGFKLASLFMWLRKCVLGFKGMAAAAQAAAAAKTTLSTVESAKGVMGMAKGGAAASIGGSVISAIGDVGLGVVLRDISNKVLEPWFALWQIYALRGYVGNPDAIRNSVRVALEGTGISKRAIEKMGDMFATMNTLSGRKSINENKLQQEQYKFYTDKNKAATHEGMSNLAAVAETNLSALDAKMFATLQHATNSFNNNTTIDNRRVQNVQNVNIHGAQDTQSIGEEVINAGKVLLGTSLNSSLEK